MRVIFQKWMQTLDLNNFGEPIWGVLEFSDVMNTSSESGHFLLAANQ